MDSPSAARGAGPGLSGGPCVPPPQDSATGTPLPLLQQVEDLTSIPRSSHKTRQPLERIPRTACLSPPQLGPNTALSRQQEPFLKAMGSPTKEMGGPGGEEEAEAFLKEKLIIAFIIAGRGQKRMNLALSHVTQQFMKRSYAMLRGFPLDEPISFPVLLGSAQAHLGHSHGRGGHSSGGSRSAGKVTPIDRSSSSVPLTSQLRLMI